MPPELFSPEFLASLQDLTNISPGILPGGVSGAPPSGIASKDFRKARREGVDLRKMLRLPGGAFNPLGSSFGGGALSGLLTQFMDYQNQGAQNRLNPTNMDAYRVNPTRGFMAFPMGGMVPYYTLPSENLIPELDLEAISTDQLPILGSFPEGGQVVGKKKGYSIVQFNKGGKGFLGRLGLFNSMGAGSGAVGMSSPFGGMLARRGLLRGGQNSNQNAAVNPEMSAIFGSGRLGLLSGGRQNISGALNSFNANPNIGGLPNILEMLSSLPQFEEGGVPDYLFGGRTKEERRARRKERRERRWERREEKLQKRQERRRERFERRIARSGGRNEEKRRARFDKRIAREWETFNEQKEHGKFGAGLRGFGDQILSTVGASDVIQGSLYDIQTPEFVKNLNSKLGSVAVNLAGQAIPAVGAITQGLGILGSLGGGQQMSNGQGGGGFGNLLGGQQQQYMPPGGDWMSFQTPMLQNMGIPTVFKGGGDVSAKIKKLMKEGYPQKQAVAIALSMKRRGKMQMGGEVNMPNLVPIQTEKIGKIPEYLIHLDGSITPVNAQKRHSKMDDDDITDVVPEGTYVASADKSTKISFKEADDVVMGLKMKPYEEFKKGIPPEEIKFSKLWKKSKKDMTPAELAKAIAETWATLDFEGFDDPITELTNKVNIQSRIPWLQQLIEFNDEKREDDEDDAEFQEGGPTDPPSVGRSLLNFTVTDDPDPKDVALTYGEDMATAQRSILVNALVLATASPQTLMAIGSKRPETLKKLKELENIIVDMGRKIPTGALPEMSSDLPNEINTLYQLQDKYLPSANYTIEKKRAGGFKHGGRARMKPMKYPFGETVADILQIGSTALPFLSSIFGGGKNSGIDPVAHGMITGSLPLYSLGLTQNIRSQQGAYDRALQSGTALGSNLSNLAVGQGMLQGIGSLSQETDLPRYDFGVQRSRLNNFNTQTPLAFAEALSTPRYDMQALASELGPRGFNTFASNMAGNQMATRNQAMINLFGQNRGLDFQRMGMLNDIDSTEQQLNLPLEMQEIQNRNAQRRGVFGAASGTLANLGNIQSQMFPILTGLDLQRSQLAGQIPMGIGQQLLNAGSILGTFGTGSQGQQQDQGGGGIFDLIKRIFGGGGNQQSTGAGTGWMDQTCPCEQYDINGNCLC